MEKSVESFGAVIKTIRQERKLTQKMLSQDICSQSVLSRIENGEELPNVVVMAQICQRLDVTIDQVMTLTRTTTHQTVKVFEEMSTSLRHKKYAELEKTLKNPETFEKLFLDKDYQRYYYYLGICELYQNEDPIQAMEYLKKGLAYTYGICRERTKTSITEIQLLSAIGKVYGRVGQLEIARDYLERSIQLIRELSNVRLDIELTRVFYNYASFLYEQKEYFAAEKQVNQGILFTKKQMSYYLLDDLFQLKSYLLKRNGYEKEAKIYQALTDNIRVISESA